MKKFDIEINEVDEYGRRIQKPKNPRIKWGPNKSEWQAGYDARKRYEKKHQWGAPIWYLLLLVLLGQLLEVFAYLLGLGL